MIYSIGCDIVDIKRLEQIVNRPEIIKNFFTPQEIAFIAQKNPARALESYAGNFCAKESIIKAFKRYYKLTDIEILRDENGAPFVNFYGAALERFNTLGITRCFVSISHTDGQAMGMVVMERE